MPFRHTPGIYIVFMKVCPSQVLTFIRFHAILTSRRQQNEADTLLFHFGDERIIAQAQ